MNDMRNFNEFFRKDATYEPEKIRVSHSPLKIYFWKNHRRGVQMTLPAVLRLNEILLTERRNIHEYCVPL